MKGRTGLRYLSSEDITMNRDEALFRNKDYERAAPFKKATILQGLNNEIYRHTYRAPRVTIESPTTSAFLQNSPRTKLDLEPGAKPHLRGQELCNPLNLMLSRRTKEIYVKEGMSTVKLQINL